MRGFKRMSQRQVAREVGLSRAAVSAIETGKRGIESLELLALARLYGYPTGFFLGEDTEYGGRAGALAQLVGDLSHDEQLELLRYADYLQARRSRINPKRGGM